MIFFDGIDITSVAPVRIEDIHIQPIALNAVARERAVTGGAEFVRMRDGTRTVSVTFALLDNDATTRNAHLSALRAWAKRDKEYKLQFAHVPDKYLEAVCTGFPEPSVRQWWESKLRITFTCYNNPYWNSIQEHSVACGTQFIVMGDALPLMRIERTLSDPATNQSYSSNGKTMTFTTIPAGNMKIDLNKQTAEINGTSFMYYYTFTSQFLAPALGAQTITGNGTVVFRERWV